jgi:hypothetical protein
VSDCHDARNQTPQICQERGIHTHFKHDLVEVRGANQEAVFKDLNTQELVVRSPLPSLAQRSGESGADVVCRADGAIRLHARDAAHGSAQLREEQPPCRRRWLG